MIKKWHLFTWKLRRMDTSIVMFLHQVDTVVQIFEQRFPGITGILLFDNAPSHKKYPPDGLNPTNMNVYLGGK